MGSPLSIDAAKTERSIDLRAMRAAMTRSEVPGGRPNHHHLAGRHGSLSWSLLWPKASRGLVGWPDLKVFLPGEGWDYVA
jgi:hypothetical protein